MEINQYLLGLRTAYRRRYAYLRYRIHLEKDARIRTLIESESADVLRQYTEVRQRLCVA